MRPDTDLMLTAGRPGLDHVGVGHANSWSCDHCGRKSGIFAGRKKTRRGWACAGCVRGGKDKQ